MYPLSNVTLDTCIPELRRSLNGISPILVVQKTLKNQKALVNTDSGADQICRTLVILFQPLRSGQTLTIQWACA